MINIKNILMPTDLSDYAGYALNYAREFASTYGALIGSVAEKVVQMAPCPVLTVKHPEHEFVLP